MVVYIHLILCWLAPNTKSAGDCICLLHNWGPKKTFDFNKHEQKPAPCIGTLQSMQKGTICPKHAWERTIHSASIQCSACFSSVEISQVSHTRNKRTQTLFVLKKCPLLAKNDAQRYYIFGKYASFLTENLVVWEKCRNFAADFHTGAIRFWQQVEWVCKHAEHW